MSTSGTDPENSGGNGKARSGNGNPEKMAKESKDDQPMEQIFDLLNKLHRRVEVTHNDLKHHMFYLMDMVHDVERQVKIARGILPEKDYRDGNRRGGNDSGYEPQPGPSRPPVFCMFCDGGHWATQCETYPTISQRHKRILQKGRCERCLLPATHLISNCKAVHPCYYCRVQGRKQEAMSHHAAFCSYKFDP